MCVQPSFQPPPVPGRGVQRRDVVSALARHFEARLPQGRDDLFAILHRAVLDALEQVIPDQVARGGFEPEAGPQLRRLDVGAVSGLLHPGPRRIVRAAPAVFVVEGVAESIERPPPTRRGDVEASACFEVAPRGEDVDVSAAAALAVQHGRPGVSVGLQPRPSRLLEGVQNHVDLGVGRIVLRRPRDHARGVLVLERQRVGHGGNPVRIPPEDLDAIARLPGRVPRPDEVVGRVSGRAGSAGEELNVHRDPEGQWQPAPRPPARWRPDGR